MKKLLLSLTLLLGISAAYSQTLFWEDNFEGTGPNLGGSSRAATGVAVYPSAPYTKYFDRVVPSDLNLQNGTYSGYQGSYIWAGEDIDAANTGTNFGQSPAQSITWSGINISGKSGLSFTGKFACDNVGGAVWEGPSVPPCDYMIVEYRVDGGAWQNAVRIFSNNTLNGAFALETTGDSLAEGAVLPSYVFTDLSYSIPQTGTTLDLRFKCSSNGGATEELAIDDFRLSETPSCTAPTITSNPPNRSLCAGGNTTFTVSATGATTYQWQVDQTGSGTFTDLTNSAPYSGVTSNILSITGATSGMNGYRYRAVAINGVVTCFANSNYGTLIVSSISTSSAQTNVSCMGGNNGVAAVSPTGGIPGYTYSWFPSGGTGSIATGLSATTYTVTVTDNIGCTATQNFTITSPPAIGGLAPLSQTNIACNGGTNGSASATAATGGSGGFTYDWTPGNPTGDGTTSVTGLSATTYTVTATDMNGCTRMQNFTITAPPAIGGLAPLSQTNIACHGGNTGTASVSSATGGSGPFTYDWTPGTPTGDGTTSVSNLTAGTWTVTATDANSCVRTQSFTITEPPAALSGTTVVTNVACNGGNTGAINLTPTGGTGPYTFSWGGGITTEDRTSLSAGTYSVTITDANTCAAVVSATVTQPPAVWGATAVANVTCFGTNTGAINLTPIGGVGPYTYNWVDGATTEDRALLTAGTYSVTITDANGCTGNVSATVTEPPTGVSGTTVVTNIACFGANTGAINLTPTGGTGPYTFSWADGPTTEDRVLLSAGTYSVTITDANACQGTVTATVTQPAATVSGTTVVTNIACFGENTGSINLTPTGGTGPYTFSWADGPTTEDRAPLTAGTYSVTITDVNGCTGNVSPTVTQPAAALSGTTVVTNVACNGLNNGAINLTPAGGTSPYTYDWGGGITTEDRTSLAAGTYSVTITDNFGCMQTVSATLTEPTALAASISSTDVSCNSGSNGTATVTVSGGTPSYTYSWSPSGGTAATATGLAAGTYTVTITDANACQVSESVTLTEPTAIAASVSSTDVSCNSGSNGTATVTVSGGTPSYTYSWSPSGGTAATATGLTAGTYTVTITDANACQVSESVTLTEPAALATSMTIINITCHGGSHGVASVAVTGGTPSYTYLWSSGGTNATATGLSAGTYTVTVTDANACEIVATATVTEPDDLATTTTSTNISCNGVSDGTATVNVTGGTPAYTYSWLPSGGTGATATGLAAGDYTVDITDANGCTISASVTLTEPDALAASIASTDVSCNGGTNGTATVTVTGGTTSYTYSWSPSGGTSATATGLAAGDYTVDITDANGCTTSVSVTLTEPDALATSIASTDVSCNGGTNGTATVTVTGGTASYSYSWSPSGGTGATATGLAAGTYTVTVTDANTCQISESVTLTEPAALATTITSTDLSCNGGTNGTATVTVTGGAPSYTYAWSPSGGTGAVATGLAAGDYTVDITDANGCTISASVTLTEPDALAASITSTDISCNGVPDGTATVDVTGGTPSYTYSWSPSGGTNAAATGLAAGDYTVDITDANGCTTSASVTLTEPDVLAATTSSTPITCNGGSDGIAAATVSGGTAPYTYAWSPSGGTNDTENGLAAGTYTVDITDAHNCTASATVTLADPAPLAGSESVTICETYTWAADGQVYTTSGTYTAVVTSAAGCDSTATLNLTILQPTQADVTETACETYHWAVTGMDYTTTGLYQATLTNAAGCDSTIMLHLTINHGSQLTENATECESFTWSVNGTNYTTSGQYQETFTGANGCDSVRVLNLTILQPTAGTDDVTSCEAYTWIDGNTYSASTSTPTFVLENAAGCDSTVTLHLTIASVTATVANNSGTLTASGGTSYQWIVCGVNLPVSNGTNATFTPGSNGQYACIVSNGTCSDTTECVNVTGLGLEELSNGSISVYPNPATAIVHVNWTASGSADVTLYDAQGKLILARTLQSSDDAIAIDQLERGVYLVKVAAGGQLHTERIVKE